MSGRTRVLLLLGACVLLVAVGASGTVVGDGDEHCAAANVNEPTVVGILDDTLETDTIDLYEGTTLEVVYCTDGDDGTDTVADRSDWLGDGDGFESDDPDDGVYTVTITGNDTVSSIEFADHVEGGAAEPSGVGVEIVRPFDSSFEGVDRVVAADYANYEGAYLESNAALENKTAELDAVVEAWEADGELDLHDGNETISDIAERHDDMNITETELREHLIDEMKRGTTTGTIAALEALEANSSDRTSETNETVNSYQDAVVDEREDSQSTVRLFVGGSLAGGLLVGAIAGAAIPLAAARRVEEKMKLSRNVTYGRASALVPIVVGLLVAIVGLAILVLIGGGATLLEVLR